MFIRTVILASLLSSCVTAEKKGACPLTQSSLPGTCRPQRSQLLVMNPPLDAKKPLAEQDASGWLHYENFLIGAFDERWVGAYELEKKRILWWHSTESSLTAPILATSSNSILLGTKDGKLTSLDADSGQQIWQVQLGSFVDREMIEHEGSVYAVTAKQQVFALSLKDGERRWSFDGGLSADIILSGGAIPAIANQQVIFGNGKGILFGVSQDGGQEAWSLDVNAMTPSASSGVNRVGDAASRKIVATGSRFLDIMSKITVFGNTALVASYSGNVAALDISAGLSAPQVLWSQTLASVTSSDFRDGVWYLGHLNGSVSALEASSGRLIWQVPTGQSIGSLYAGEGSLYVGGSKGRVTALKKLDGSIFWYDDIGGNISHPPMVIDKTLFFATGSKVLYGYEIL